MLSGPKSKAEILDEPARAARWKSVEVQPTPVLPAPFLCFLLWALEEGAEPRLEYHDLLGLFEMLDDGDGEISIDELLGRSPGNCSFGPESQMQQNQSGQNFGCLQHLGSYPPSSVCAEIRHRSRSGAPGANRHSSSGTLPMQDASFTTDLSRMIPRARFLENARRLKGPAKAASHAPGSAEGMTCGEEP